MRRRWPGSSLPGVESVGTTPSQIQVLQQDFAKHSGISSATGKRLHRRDRKGPEPFI
jgi:hypothetical protein